MRHGFVLGGRLGNMYIRYESNNEKHGDGFDVNDWMNGHGLKCDGWSQLIDQRVNTLIVGRQSDDCWAGKKMDRGDKNNKEGNGGHAWYRFQAPNGAKSMDPWPSGGWSY